MDTGQYFSGTIYTPAAESRPRSHTAKGLCIRLGAKNEAAVCYDTELLRVSAAWTGAFLNIDPARYGIIQPPVIAGDVQFVTPVMPGWAHQGRFIDTRAAKPFGPLPSRHAHYRGMYVHGNRVVLSYSVGEADILESPWYEVHDGLPIFTRTVEVGPSQEPLELLACGPEGVAAVVGNPPGVSLTEAPDGLKTIRIPPRETPLRVVVALASRTQDSSTRLASLATRLVPAPNLREFSQPGPVRWSEPIVTTGEMGEPGSGPFAIDSLTLPFENPYRALFFVSGHDFFSDGSAAICTVHGDVWYVTGIDDRLERLQWRRFATGLFQPLGLKIVQDTVYVVGRDQITRLHDRDGNGEADFYENFNNEGHVTTNGHEFATCLETDSQGNFYYLKGDSGGKTQHDGCLLRVSSDGSRIAVHATGFRNANGMGIGPGDQITVAPQEGEWTQASGIFRVQPGGFHGATSVHHQPTPPTDYVKPICWLSRRTDNSSGGQVWVPEDHWGPFGGKMLHFSYGQCTAMLVLTEQIDDQQQGGVVPLPLTFRSGAMRGRFHPRDGHLYVSGLRGWVSNAVADGCFQRVRYVDQPKALPVQVRTRANGLMIAFNEPLDRQAAESLDNYQAEQWNYRWSAQYGSPELRPSQPNVEGRDPVVIESASLLPDRRTIFLEIPDLKPVSILQLDFLVKTESGSRHEQRLSYTIHRVPETALPAEQLTGRRATEANDPLGRQTLVSGLQFRLSALPLKIPGGEFLNPERPSSTQTVYRRMATVRVAPGEAPASLFPAGPFRVVMDGFVRPKEPGFYRLRCSGTGFARVYLRDSLVAGIGARASPSDPAPATDGTDVELRGFVPLRVVYEHMQPNEMAEFHLTWQRGDGIEQPIPPTALYCAGYPPRPEDVRWSTIDAITRYRCLKCHTFGSQEGVLEVEGAEADGPSLVRAGDRLNPGWVAAWLLHPTKLRNESSMPALLGGDPDSAETRQRAADLAAFVATLTGTSPRRSDAIAAQTSAADVQRGGGLWEQLGCIGCHRLTPVDEKDPQDRLSLQFVVKKFRPGALEQFLRKPHADYATTRMPDFRLTEVEAQSLAQFLFERTRAARLDADANPLLAGDAAAGKRLAESLRCHACHDLGPGLPRESAIATRTRVASNDERTDGCLSLVTRVDSRAPRFPIPDDMRPVINKGFQGDWLAGPWRVNAADESRRLVDSLRCQVCHALDDQPSRLPTILAEEGERGLPSESLPNLTWAGERLQREWVERLIGGGIAERPRPFLTTRMPAFPAYAKTLAQGLAAQHGIGDATTVPQQPVPASESWLEHGYRLTQRDGGLDCRQCHAVGNQPAQGDDKTRLAPGINFAQIPQRLRYDFYRRFILDPPRYDVLTRMPTLSPDGRTTPIQDIYNGDARKQFDAIWGYLQTIDGVEP